MAGQLSPDLRLTRLRRVGLLTLAGLSALALAAAALLAGSPSSSRPRYVVRPEQPVFGVAVGSPVRLRGVVVGEVASVRLWRSGPGAPLRPELALSLDPRRCPGAGDLAAQVDQGLRVELLPVNPASGFLEVDLVWRPGAPAVRATDDLDELPMLPSGASAVSRAASFLRAVAEGNPAEAARDLAGRLDAAERAVADPALLARQAAAAAGELLALAETLDREAGPDRLALAGARLAEARERLASLGVALDAQGASLAEGGRAAPAWLEGLSGALRRLDEEVRGARPTPSEGGR